MRHDKKLATEVGKRIRLQRNILGLTQGALGNKIDISQGRVSAWESGTQVPGGESILKMARLFKTSCDYLLGL